MDIPLLIILAALVLAVATFVLFLIVVIAIRAEDGRRRLDSEQASHAERITRRLVGAYTSVPSARRGGDCP
ncbi:hypothetical protein [Nonomuraea endophytica]|uniref:Putative membrane protein n=1 Tax=Nonomuraea endophytica TaxID=714136 RepID=A0A7W8AEM2_9ACTN|nr:hypothetical protein [Nonomuraea endophytica]MBB5083765.1 putative membrane protein [Nonomuraea endophytica]